MKKILCLLISVLLVLPMFAACSESKLSISISNKGAVEVGTECVVPEAMVLSSVPYSLSCEVTDPNGYSVILSEAKTFFVSVGGDYKVEYTATTATETVTATTKISTVDVESPIFKNQITEMRFVKGEEVTIPDLKITDKGGAIKPVFDVTDNTGKKYSVSADYKFTADDTAHTYTIKILATDKGGNKAEKTIIGKARSSEYEVEGFNTADLNGNYVADGGNGTLGGVVDFPGFADAEPASGKVLKFSTADSTGDTNTADWGAYYDIKIKTTGIADLRECEGLILRVYNDGPALSGANALTLNKKGDIWDGSGANKSLKANSWNEIKWSKAELEQLLDGGTYDGFSGKSYKRSTIDNLQELTLHIDNSGYWGTDEGISGGGNLAYANQKFTLYFDSIKVQPIDMNWTPEVFEADEKTIYEINNFDNIGRMSKLDFMDSDMSKVDYSLVGGDKWFYDRENSGAMKVTFTHSANFYPNMVMNISKLKEILGKKLSQLPDDAAFVMDVAHYYQSQREGAYEGNGCYRFYKEGSTNDQTSKIPGEYIWLEGGSWGEFRITVAQIKDGLNAHTIDEVDRIGFFFYMDAAYAGGASTTFLFDNWRLEVPKA